LSPEIENGLKRRRLGSLHDYRILWIIFIIFREGGRSRNGSMMPFKQGLGMLVAGKNVPVVHCGLTGTFEALPPHRKVPHPVKIKLRIGDPLQFTPTANDRVGWSHVAHSVESAVCTLVSDADNLVCSV
jgi:1-acyl-sn-glycerol-3-phosphate acyltransferase